MHYSKQNERVSIVTHFGTRVALCLSGCRSVTGCSKCCY